MSDNLNEKIAGDGDTTRKTEESIADAERHIVDSVDKLAESQKLLRRLRHEK